MVTFKPNKHRTAFVCDPLGGSVMNPRKEKPPTRESQIEKRLVQRVKEIGGEVRKVKWIGRNKAPDRIVMLPAPAERFTYSTDDGRTIWVEVKPPGSAATFPNDAHEAAQAREHRRMRKMGQRVEVVDSYERIEEILK